MRRFAGSLLLVCLLVPLAHSQQSQSAGQLPAVIASDHYDDDRVAVSDAEKIAFNTKSLKYHCLTCSAAKRCTVNCITITKGEARRRGGVACKICGGSCD